MMTFAHTHTHANDPETSHEAASSMPTVAEQHKCVIWSVLLFFDDLTSQEIANRCNLDYWQVARRISDLKRDGKVVDSGARRASPGGRTACVWRLA